MEAILCTDQIKLSTTNREKLIKELLQGQDFANQLQLLLLHKPFQQHGSVSAQDLVVKILRSFTDTLSVLSSCVQSTDDQNPPQATSSNDSPSADDRRSEDSGESKRPASKDRRGCYKRKKNLQTRTTVSYSTEDGHAWRKYGQKEILNAKHPRSYFRCTHKYDQGCRATKQVQRMEKDPQMYETTYIGNHTCRDIISTAPIITDSDHPWGISGSHTVTSSFSTTPTKIKQETSDDLSENLSSLDSVMWEDLVPFESSDAAALVSDYGDHVISSTVYSYEKISSHSFDVDFECEFHFDECEFF